MKRLKWWFCNQIKNHWLFVIVALIILSATVRLAFVCRETGVLVNIEKVVAIAAGLTTIISLVLVYEGLRRTRIAAEAQLLSAYNDKYFENDMLDAIRVLRKWGDEHQTCLQKQRTPEKNPRNAPEFEEAHDITWPSEVDRSRRKVKAYFVNALDLYERDMLSRRFFNDIVNKEAITTLFDIVEPLEWLLNKQYDASKFYRLMEYASEIYKARSNGKFQNNRVKDEDPTPQAPPSSGGAHPANSYAFIHIGCVNQR